MRHAFFVVAAAVLAVAAPSLAAADLPPVVMQLAPPGKLLDDIRSMANAVGGDVAVKQFNDQLKAKLGDKGLSGLDLTRPPVFGIYYRENAPKDKDGYMMGLAPITDEKDFLALMEKSDAAIKPVAGKKGLYLIEPKQGDSGYLQVKDGFAYFATGVTEAEFDLAKFPAYEKLVVPGETAVLAARVFVDRLPAGAQKKMSETLDEAVKNIANMPLPEDAKEGVKKATERFGAAAKRYLTQAKDANEAVFRIVFDPASSEAALEIGVIGKPGSSLAKDIADRKATTNRFAGFVNKSTVAGMLLGVPLTNEDIREGIAGAFESGAKDGLASAPPAAKPALDELFKGLGRTFRSGEFDAAVAMNGPDKDGHYAVSVGLSFDDPTALEKELRSLYKTAPAELKAFLKLDAAKAGNLNVHVARLGPILPPEAQNVFGEEAELAFTFAPKGIYLTFGTNPLDTLKAGVEAAPKAARSFDIVLNPNRLEKLVTAVAGPQAGAKVSEALGAEDKLSSAFFIGVDGGAELKVRIGLNLKVLPRIGFATTMQQAKP